MRRAGPLDRGARAKPYLETTACESNEEPARPPQADLSSRI